MATLLAVERTTSLLRSYRWLQQFCSAESAGSSWGRGGAFLCGVCITRLMCQRSSYVVTSGVAVFGIKRTAACVITYTEWLLHVVAATVFHIGILHNFENADFMVGHHVNMLNPVCTEVTAFFFNECNPVVLLMVQTLTQYLFRHI